MSLFLCWQRTYIYDPHLHLDLCIDEDEVIGCNRKLEIIAFSSAIILQNYSKNYA